MKKLEIYLGILVFSIVLAGGALFAEEENLLSNGDFEKVGANNIPAFWKASRTEAMAADEEVRYDGEFSLKLSLKELGLATSVYTYSSPFPVKPDTLYLITLWYKAEGFGGEKNAYRGASSSCDIKFKKADGKEVPRYDLTSLHAGYPWSLSFPYKDVKNWQIATSIVKSPKEADSAYFEVNLGSNNPEVFPTIWLDSVWIREYTPPEAKGKVYTYEVKRNSASSKVVKDKDAEDGIATVAVKGKHNKGYMVDLYEDEQAPGQYKVVFRLKVDDNTKNVPVFAIAIRSKGFINNTMYATDIKATDFTSPNKYQEFPVEVVKPPSGRFQFLVIWSGEVSGWIDSVKVIEEKSFTDEDMENFWK